MKQTLHVKRYHAAEYIQKPEIRWIAGRYITAKQLKQVKN